MEDVNVERHFSIICFLKSFNSSSNEKGQTSINFALCLVLLYEYYMTVRKPGMVHSGSLTVNMVLMSVRGI